mgnify:CR=1 FL=1
MEWSKLIENIVNTAVFSTAATLLIGYFINKKFKAYEVELQNNAETHKKYLEELYYKASKLHDKRLKIISSLYGNIVELDLAMKDMTNRYKLVSGIEEQDDKDEKNRIEEAGDSYSKFYYGYIKNKIYFSEATCLLLDKLKDEYWNSYWDYTYTKRFGDQGFEFNYQLAIKASNKVQQDIPPVLRKLESDFRKIINVKDE